MAESALSVRARWPAIIKRPDWPVSPNLLDYERARTEFSWAKAQAELDGLPDGRGLNIAHEAIDRHAVGPRGNRVALRWLSREGVRRGFTYADLDEKRWCPKVCRSPGAKRGGEVPAWGAISRVGRRAGDVGRRGVSSPRFSSHSAPSRFSPGSTSLVHECS